MNKNNNKEINQYMKVKWTFINLNKMMPCHLYDNY